MSVVLMWTSVNNRATTDINRFHDLISFLDMDGWADPLFQGTY